MKRVTTDPLSQFRLSELITRFVGAPVVADELPTESPKPIVAIEPAWRPSDRSESAPKTPKSLLDWGPDGLYDDTRAAYLHGTCHSASDGECNWRECPQLKKYRSHCPLDRGSDR